MGRVSFMAIVFLLGAARLSAQERPTVERMMREDSVLAALDRQLNEVYKAALAKARDDMPKALRAEQRGWIKGRDECWKAENAEEYLTATWTAHGMRECIEAKYRLRISELQAIWQLVPSEGPLFFGCNGDARNEIVATFYRSLIPTVRLERGDRTVLGWRIPAVEDGVYEGPNLSVIRKGTGVTVIWFGETLECTAQQR